MSRDIGDPDDHLETQSNRSFWQETLRHNQGVMCAEECTRRIREEGREDLREGVELLFAMNSENIWLNKPFPSEAGPPTTYDTPDEEKVVIGVVPREKRDAVYAVLFEILSIDPIAETIYRAERLADGWNPVYGTSQLRDIGMDRPDSVGILFEIPGGKFIEQLRRSFTMEMWQYLKRDKELSNFPDKTR